MALGTAIIASMANVAHDRVAPVSITANWQTVIDAGGVAVQDAATITNPTTQITASTRHIYQRRGQGTLILVRVGYDDGLTGITSPVVKVFGRSGNDIWTLLKSKAGSIAVTITADNTTDVSDGTLLYTTPDVSATAWDCLGCDEILVGVQTVLAGGGSGVVNNSILQMCCI